MAGGGVVGDATGSGAAGDPDEGEGGCGRVPDMCGRVVAGLVGPV